VITASPNRRYSGHCKVRRTRRPKNTWNKGLEKMWMAGFTYSWRRMEVAAPDIPEGDQLSVAYAP